MSGPTVAEFILERLHEWGVGRIYGYPGDGINGLLGAFHEVGDRVRFVQTRHEEIASFAACAHAKLTGEVGVCMATSGPGAIHLLNGLYDAKLDHQPVVAIVGQQARTALGADYQQEVDLTTLYKDVAHEFVEVCMVPAQARQLVDRAMRIAAATRSPTCIIVPNDVQESPYEEPARAHGSVFTSPGFHRPRPVPDATQLAAAADLINAGERPAILIGQGAIGAEAEVIELAERIGAGVAKALNGRAALPDDLPFVTGSIGLLGTKPSFSMMEGCDTLILIGTGFPYAEWLPPEGQARAVQIDIDPRRLGMRYPTEVGLTGDSAATLQALLPLLEEQRDRRWQETIADDVERWWRILDERAHQSADPINPQLVFHELSARLPDRAILTADSGSATNWWARHLRMRSGMQAALSGTLATMCPSVPYALAAKFAYPDRPVIAVIGDGAMQMLGINALIDIARYHEEWSNRQLVVCVLHNNDLNQVTWEQRVMSGNPKLDASQVLPDVDLAGYARLLGLGGIRVDRPEDVGPAWDEALGAGGPVLLDVVTDPEVPPLPPHIRLDQVKGIASTLRHGDPAARRILVESFKGKLAEFTTR
ncbi:thiamine pyrophosphate-requiring protein [Paraconexibacter antarcticus]|uniref:Thiamine pyrophosphate-requiring protein n=1 Tax=Paraconexibacter antarcticus TaxID=2949664 RepID=A0ABY5DTI5_9ACTN|nr:thiamine pyrophosphate-requiring protein [Paraconexibacter antarcticus]UTI65346.1 thiamine pyrophosphate-requiring protein [Paraconexibacter antarcticus]